MKMIMFFMLLISSNVMLAQSSDKIVFKYIGINDKPIPTLFINNGSRELDEDFFVKSIYISNSTFAQLETFVRKNKKQSDIKAIHKQEDIIIQVSLTGKGEIICALLDKKGFTQYIFLLGEALEKNKKDEVNFILQNLNDIKRKLPY